MKQNAQINKVKRLFQLCLILLMGIFLALPTPIWAQEEEEEIIEEEMVKKQVVSLSELSTLMHADESEIILSDLEIAVGEGDEAFMADKIFYSVYEIYPKASRAKKIYFYNCHFNTGAAAPIVFNGWTFNKLNLIGCEVNSPLIFENFKTVGNYPIHIENCSFKHNLQFTNEIFEVNKLEIFNSVFKKSLNFNTTISQLLMDNCQFRADTILYKKEDEEMTHFQMSLKNQSFEHVEINNCLFTSNGISNLFSLDMSKSTIQSLRMFNNKMQAFDLSWATVEKSLLIDSLFVSNYIGILNFDFPEKNTNIPWYNLGGEKLAVFYTEKSDLIIPYQAKTNEQLSITLDYNDLISAYTKFNTLYHERGDISSANASYVEIKTIETRRQAFIQEINPSFNNIINYKLNVFLSFFSDYATNPGKSLIQSLWVLLIFTVLYMFSFSGWDGINYKFYIGQVNVFSDYITSTQKMHEILEEARKKRESRDEELQDIRKEMEKYQRQNKKIPRVIKLVGEPIYFMGRIRFDIIPGMFKLFAFQEKTWAELNDFEKVKSGFNFLLITIVFSIYVFILKLFTSFMLSLNSFVVIGFGALPEENRSFAMYLTIIEGIIGWFLLTIFTITLLSQVLQSAG